MTLGVPPRDIFHNGAWYLRNGNPATGLQVVARSATTIGHSGTTSPATLASVTCPPMGLTDQLRISGKLLVTNNANAKTWGIWIGGNLACQLALANSDATSFAFTVDPRGSLVNQVAGQDNALGGTFGSFRFTSASLGLPFLVDFIATLGVATDLFLFESYVIELIRG